MGFIVASDTFGDSTDVLARMADVGLAAVSQDSGIQDALVDRKGIQARSQLIIDLKSKIARAMQPLGNYPGGVLSSSLNAPEDVLATLTNASILNETWVIYTIYAMLEEGETRLRFKYEDAGEAISKSLDRWERKKRDAFEKAWVLCTFDLNGDGTLTYLERGFTNRSSSVRVSF